MGENIYSKKNLCSDIIPFIVWFLTFIRIPPIPKSVCFIAVIGMRWKSSAKIESSIWGVYGGIGW